MTPSEKWERLTNPKTIGDYGISILLSELAEVPEAIEELKKYGLDEYVNPETQNKGKVQDV